MKILRILSLSAVLGGCSPQPDPTFAPEHRAALGDSVRQLMVTLASEVSAQGFTAWIPYLEQAERFVWTSDGKIEFPSADSLARFIRPFAATLTHTSLAFDTIKVSPLAPGVAQAAATYRELFVGQKHDTTRLAGVFIGVWVRTPAGWRLVSGHTSHPAAAH